MTPTLFCDSLDQYASRNPVINAYNKSAYPCSVPLYTHTHRPRCLPTVFALDGIAFIDRNIAPSTNHCFSKYYMLLNGNFISFFLYPLFNRCVSKQRWFGGFGMLLGTHQKTGALTYNER